ncbi:hypothetical protein O0L34_g10835 [Tuta absoluta]|nr:hypothetical protein O0L34_g10835 [Tuta absoluta]
MYVYFSDIEASLPHGGLTKHDIAELNKKANEEKLLKEKLDNTVDEAERTIQLAQQDLNKMTKAPGVTLDADQEEALRRQLELKLALTNKAAAALVASTHPDTVCYTTATEATEKIAEFIPDIVKDAALLSNAGDDKFKNRLMDHIRALCEASKRLVRARTNHQVIERARGIGDISSALAEGAAGVAGSAGAPHMLRICDAGRAAADAARAFVYTAKLVAPTVHHQQCSNSLITAAHELSTQMKHFSSTWKPLASEAKFSKPVAEMTGEADNLERLLDEFRQDLAAGKLVKIREVEKIIVEDTALRRLASQIMELAQMHAESGNMADDKKKLFTSYASSLKNAIRALDVANSRCKRDPKDLSKHQDLEDAVQNLQINLLSSRPCAGDHINNDVVDLTDFVKDSSKKAEKLIEVANKVKIGKENKDEVESIKAECHKINLTAFRLLSPDGRQDGDETSLDGYLDIDQFGQDCETHVQNMKSSIDAIHEKELKEALSKSSLALNESCQYLRFATKSALATAQSASLNETLHALVDLETGLDKMLVSWETTTPATKVIAFFLITTPATKVSDDAGLLKARSRVIRAAAEISRDAAPQVPAAVSAYVCEIRARTDLHDKHERNRAKDHINRVLELVKQLTAVASTQVATWQPIACPQVTMIVQQLVEELESAVVTDGGEKSSGAALKEVDINRLLMPADVIIEGEPKKIEEKLQNTASKLVMLTDTLSQSALRPESLARTAPAITEAALQLAAAARSIPAQVSVILHRAALQLAAAARSIPAQVSVILHRAALQLAAAARSIPAQVSVILHRAALQLAAAARSIPAQVSVILHRAALQLAAAARSIPAQVSVILHRAALQLAAAARSIPAQVSVILHRAALQLAAAARSIPAQVSVILHRAALQLAAAARSIPAQSLGQAKRKEEAAQEMCWATYNLLKVGEAVTRSKRGDARIRLRSATGSLTDAINKLVSVTTHDARLSCAGDKLNAACSEQTRALQAALGRSQPAPCAAPPIQHCVQALSGQREVLEKLNSDEPMSRVEFSKSLSYVTAAVCNSTEFAAQSAYLITLSETNRELASEGLVDVPRLQKLTAAMQESCYLIMRSNHVEIAKEEESKLSRLNADLQSAVKEANARTKDGATKRELTEHAFKVDHATKTLGDAVSGSDTCMDKITTHTLTLVDCVGGLNATLDRPGLIPVVGDVSAATRAMSDDIIQHSKALINKTQALIKEVKNADDDEDPMTWVTYNTQRKSVMGAFEALLRSVRQNGERAGLVEVEKEAEEEPEVQQKSFIQIQEEIARKWLQRRPSNADVQTAGEAAARDIIDVAENMTEAMKDPEKGEILNVISESRQLVTECSNKYDNDKASLLMEHLRELRRAVQRGVVTCLVEDYLHDEPLQDLELFIHAEQDETKRKFLLEKKLAELMSQLGRTTRTARLVARAGVPTPELDKCREQTELLAPRLVAAAQARVSRPDDARATDAYRALLAEYAASLARVQHLCDQAVDPLDFVQTAGETMARMREETTQHGDPMTCAYTSKAITRLASRVISVSMSSTVARADPELRAALTEAQDKLTATVPAPGTRESRLPDWKDTTAEILRTTGEVESALGGENIFKKLPEPDQPIYNAALSLHSAVRGWSARDNEIVGVAKRMAVLMARLSDQMNTDRKRELIVTSKNIVKESNEVAALAKKLANECSDVRIKMNLLQVCERIPTISGQLKMLTVVKGSTLGNQGGEEDREAMNMLVTNAQNLMSSVQEVVKAAASASVKIASQRGLKWVRKNY